jgi:hypothetical protein
MQSNKTLYDFTAIDKELAEKEWREAVLIKLQDIETALMALLERG